MRLVAFISGALMCTFLGRGSADARTNAPEPVTAVNQLFSKWTAPQSPGCAVSVSQSQKVLFKGAYGNAIVETSTPNTTATAFQVASVSKQFTAFAIHLLKDEGKLSLDDDVRKHVPELHAFDRPLTIRHLLHHTSGLRDLGVGALKGRFSDALTQGDVLRTLFDQRELNFTPGSRFSYSNSNYTLLALIAERVSGQSLGEFLATRVFKPLGMKNTYVQDNLRKLRSGEAWPYGPGADGLERRLHLYSNYGSTNLRTSAEDIALWAMNLDQPKVGNAALIAAMRETVRDDDGATLSYASGLEVGHYRGAGTIRHGGIDPGYASFFLAFPDHRFSVAVMCNTETNEPQDIAYRIADIYLDDRLGPAAKEEPRSAALSEQQLQRFAGFYKEESGAVFAVQSRDGKLFMQGQDEMIPAGENEFKLNGVPVRFSFSDGPGTAPFRTLMVHDPDAKRKTVRFVKSTVPDLTPQQMPAYEGNYYSPELSTIVTVKARQDALWLIGPGYETRIQQPPQMFRLADTFFTEHMIGGLQFIRDKRGQVTELTASNGRVMNLRFLKMGKLPALEAARRSKPASRR